jgi:prolyl-tRNA editing enzyme YbaK/EbsC (Cys-tRNA(Pro) deacylase)
MRVTPGRVYGDGEVKSKPVPIFRRIANRYQPVRPLDPAALDALASKLSLAEFPFEIVDHGGRDAAAVAAELGLPAEARLSVALLRGRGSEWVAITQVTRLLDLAAAGRAVGEAPLVTASVAEVRRRFGVEDPGALSPLVAGRGLRHLLDRPVADLDRALCAAGRWDCSILVEPRLLVELVWPVVSDVTTAPLAG